MSNFPPILAIFYSEFHPVQGPKVLYQVPEGFITSVDFDSFSEYMIPKTALCNRFITFSTDTYKIMGYPVQINDSKYKRNNLLFNFCFVFDKEVEVGCYQQIIVKIARILQSLEIQEDFLTRNTSMNHYLHQIMEDLNTYHECQIMIDEVNTLDLKLFPQHPDPPMVQDSHVPVLLYPLQDFIHSEWDLTMQKIIPCINGIHSVDMISKHAGVDLHFVRLGIQHLHYYGCIALVDIFQFGNLYATLDKVNELLNQPLLQQECIEFVKKDKPISIGMIVTLYCALKGSMTVLEWMREYPSYTSQIDIRKFIVFGLIHGILLRIHVYPILITPDASLSKEIGSLLHGQYHMDDLCTRFKRSYQQLTFMFRNSAIEYIYK